MACPTEEHMIALLGGELDAEARRELLDHIGDCDACWAAARELLVLRQGIVQAVEAEPCPDREEMLDFVSGQLSQQRQEAVHEHMARCPACAALVRELSLLAPALTENDLLGQTRAALRAIVEQHLRSAKDIFDELWRRACELRDRLGPEAQLSGRPASVQAEVQGALGAGVSDPAATITFSAMLICLDVASELAEQETAPTREQVGELVRCRAEEADVGEGLKRTLCEVLPKYLVP
ncbi:MAG: anti-sigma factor family protein [bacterium]